jgi:integrase
MTKELVKILQDEKGKQDLLSKTTGINYEFVCSWEDGRALRPLYITKTFTKYVENFGFRKITFHGLRHTHATILYTLGADSQQISKRLRHSRVSTTDDIYIHVSEDIKRNTAQIFEKGIEKDRNRTDKEMINSD